MNKILKTISICSVAFLAGLAITACGNKKTTKKVTTKVTSKQTTTEVEGGCAINVEGLTDDLSIKFSGVIDGQTKELDVNKKYEAGTVVTARVTNNSTKKIKLTAFDGTLIAGRDIIDPNATGAVFDITLSDTVKFKIEDASDITTASLDITGDEVGDTSTKTNDIRIYSDSFVKGVDFTLADKLIVGEKIKIQLLNHASDVFLNITNGSDTFDEAYSISNGTNDPVIEITVKGDVSIEFETLTAKLTYDFSITDDVEADVYYIDGTKRVVIDNNSDVPLGREVFIETLNMSDTNKYILQISDYIGFITKTSVIGSDIDIITSFTMSEDTRDIELIEYDEYDLNIVNTYSDVVVTATYLDGDDETTITDKVPVNSLVTLEAVNSSTTDRYIIKFTMGEDTMVRALDADDTYYYEGIEMTDDITIEILPYSEVSVDIYNSYLDVELTASVYYIGDEEPIDLDEEDVVVKGALIEVHAKQPQGDYYGLKIYNGEDLIVDTNIKYDSTGVYYFFANGDVEIIVTDSK